MADFDIISFFQQYAYQPGFVYLFIILFMTASSFGLPIPEEMTLVSAGLVAYMARHPEIYPPPYEGAVGVNLYLLATICFFAIFASDIFVYMLGKFFGKKIIQTNFFKKKIGTEVFDKINKWFNKYDVWACGIFRFTPGARFPGHMSCGLLGVPLWKFALIDGAAALISVPTQVLLVAFYGEIILSKVKEFKMALGVVVGLVLIVYIIKKVIKRKRKKTNEII